MTKFHSTAKKMGNSETIGHSKNEVYYPHIYFDENQLPAILDWKIGGEYEVTIKIKQTAIRKEKNRPVTADFDITGVAIGHDNNKHEGIKKIGDMLSKRQSKN